MRVVIATDAWSPQVNGVVFALQNLASAAREQGVSIEFLTPGMFATVPMPTYPEIRLSLVGSRAIQRRLDAMRFDHIHIATEGPIGMATRRLCRRNKWQFTTSFHTRFPEYIRARFGVPVSWSYIWLRNFHNAAAGTMVATPSLLKELKGRGFSNLAEWSRGVDHETFADGNRDALPFPRPIFLYVGRLAVEKNVEAFLALDLPGTKVIVGDGPARSYLSRTYPDAVFLGTKPQAELADIYASADAFVFPSRTDTFGMVLIEALACGLPVAAFPVPGPLDVIGDSKAGCLDEDLRKACLSALTLSRDDARDHAARFSWKSSARQFVQNILSIRSAQDVGALPSPVGAAKRA